jgi:hypothetical protein
MTALCVARTIKPATSAVKIASWAAAALVALAVPFISTTASAQADRPSERNQPYATLGEWLVEFVPADRQRVLPAYCQVGKVFDQGVQLRMVSGSTLYAIDFQGQDYLADNAKTFELEYWFDRPSPNTPSRRTVANLITDGDGFDWIRIEEPNDRPGSADEMMKAQLLSIRSSTRREPWQFQLQGVNRALNALFDCRDEKVLGRPRRAAPVAQPAPQFAPAPQFQPATPPAAQFRAPPPSMNNGDYCNGYASEMVSNTARALQVRCAGWPAGHANHAGHFKWCMTKPRGDVEKARASWGGRLQGCLASQGGGARPQGNAYQARWDWKGALKSKRDPNNTSSFDLKSSTSAVYCYKQDCRTVTVAKGPDGSLSFSTNRKNYFELNPRNNQFHARFWEDFAPPARAPDATAVFVKR